MNRPLYFLSPFTDGLVSATVAFVAVSNLIGSAKYMVIVEVVTGVALTVWIRGRFVKPQTERNLLALEAVALGILWALQLGVGFAIAGIVGWFIFFIRSLRRSGDADEDAVQTSRFIWDLVFLAVIVLFSRFTPSATAAPAPTTLAALILSLIAIMSRFATMHLAQVNDIEDGDASQSRFVLKPFVILFGLMIVSLFTMVMAPNVRETAFVIVLCVLGTLLVVVFWREVMLQAGIAGILFLILYGVWTKLQLPSTQSSTSRGFSVASQPMTSAQSFEPWSAYVNWGLVVLVLAVSAIAFRMWRTRRQLPSTGSQVTGITVERTPMSSGTTRNRVQLTPLRHLTLRWLRWEAKQGSQIERGETLRNYGLRRLAAYRDVRDPTQNEDIDESLLAVIERYELERYGLQIATREEVNKLEAILRDKTFLRR